MAFVLKTLVDEDKKKNDDKKETSALRKLLTPTRTALYSPNTGALAEVERTWVGGGLGKQFRRRRKALREAPIAERCVREGAVSLARKQPDSASSRLRVDVDRAEELPMSDALRVSAQSGTRRQGASVSYLGTPTTPLSLSAKGLLATEGGPNCAGSVQLGTDFVGDNRVSVEGRYGDEEAVGHCTTCNWSTDLMHGDAAYALAHTRLVGGPRGGRLFGRWYTDAGVGSSLVLQLEKAVKGDAVVSPMVVVERGGGATQRWQASLAYHVRLKRRVVEAFGFDWGQPLDQEADGAANKPSTPPGIPGAVRAMAQAAFDNIRSGVQSAGGLVGRRTWALAESGTGSDPRSREWHHGTFEWIMPRHGRGDGERAGEGKGGGGLSRTGSGQAHGMRRGKSFSEHLMDMDQYTASSDTSSSGGSSSMYQAGGLGSGMSNALGIRGIVDNDGLWSLQVTLSIGDVQYRDLPPLFNSVIGNSI